ncbi:Thylakoid membrane phosphoprotein 14 kDa [Zostera marina]|uniref:Thylakoid membrane phosphoprotein 14 kDa n=1 Tax=Zostera marina TaxID=29655 RepID=A0A0K9PRB8_ZOSMR|nr:Thylakoid membrane phosphoprotein 14 kDa [Zostera marina]
MAAAAVASTCTLSRQCMSLTTPLRPSSLHFAPLKAVSCGRRIPRNVSSRCSKAVEPTVEVSTPAEPTVTETTTDVTAEQSELLNFIQEKWDKVDDKYAVSSLAVAGIVALIATSGVISAIDRLPLLPGVFELVGIGYTGWFAYENLLTQTKRDALIEKIKCTYGDVI